MNGSPGTGPRTGREASRRAAGWGGAVVAALLAGACATTSAPTAGTGSAELRELREEIAGLKRKSTVNEIELQRLRVKVAELELAARRPEGTRDDPRSEPARSSGLDRGEVPIQPEPVGVIESSDLGVPEVVPPLPEGRSDGEAGSVPPDGTEPTAEAPATPPLTSSGPTELTDEAQALYDEGYTLYNRGEFVAAETSFQRYLQRFPRTSLADNAQFWIGEARFGRGDLRGALAAFRETVNRFPDGNKAPDALLRTGRCFEELGDEEGAIVAYRELVRRFPQSADALLAADRLRALEG